jgi:hypothetical protein
MGDQTSDGRTENSATMVSVSSSQATPGKSYDNSVQGSSTIEDPMSPLLDQQQDQDSIATTSISSPEKKLLSRKALKALRRIRMAKKLLLEDDIRAELAEVFGNTTDLSDELNLPISKNPVQEDVEMSQNDDGSSASLSSNSTHQQQTASTGQHAEVTTKSTKDTTHKNTNSGTGQTPSTNRNVTFAEATANRNCNNLRKGNLQGTPSTPINPYLKKQDQGTLFAKRSTQNPIRVDKIVTLKKNNSREHIHRYTLHFKTIQAKNDDESHQLVKETLQRFLEIVLQADSKTIIPPYLELDRNDKSVSDLSSLFSVSSVESFHTLKKYFFRLSARDEGGLNWCSIILAQSMPFEALLRRLNTLLRTTILAFGPKHLTMKIQQTQVGYFTPRGRKTKITYLLFCLRSFQKILEPIRASTYTSKNPDKSEEKVKALHVECAVDRLREVQDKLAFWYNSSSTRFPDGTKMRLVPTITSVTSMNNKSKFASCVARQAALNAGLASAITREISTNLLLDRKDPSTLKSSREVLMEITPEDKPGTTLFHTIERQFKSDVIVNFQFHPEHASKANNLIAGLVPFLKDNGHSYHLKMFTPEALQCHAKARWNAAKREVDSETDAELANLLAADDDLNFTDEPTLAKANAVPAQDPAVVMEVPEFPIEHMPSMRPDDDSVSTFHPGAAINLTEEYDDERAEEGTDTSSQKTSATPVSILRSPRLSESDAISRISMSDSITRISSLETEITVMEKKFKEELLKLQDQAESQAKSQLLHGSMLTEILSTLKQFHFSVDATSSSLHIPPIPSEVVNHPQTQEAGGSSGAAGHG